MAEFTLDTSGVVVFPGPPYPPWFLEATPFNPNCGWTWLDLSPFAQGYVAAALESVDLVAHWLDSVDPYRAPAYADLAPETLAAMLRDCEAYGGMVDDLTEGDGRQWWGDRQAGRAGIFRPLTLDLGGDGKIHQREAA